MRQIGSAFRQVGRPLALITGTTNPVLLEAMFAAASVSKTVPVYVGAEPAPLAGLKYWLPAGEQMTITTGEKTIETSQNLVVALQLLQPQQMLVPLLDPAVTASQADLLWLLGHQETKLVQVPAPRLANGVAVHLQAQVAGLPVAEQAALTAALQGAGFVAGLGPEAVAEQVFISPLTGQCFTDAGQIAPADYRGAGCIKVVCGEIVDFLPVVFGETD